MTDFITALKEAKRRGNVVIPDIKCVSPRDGDLLRGRDPVDIAKELVASGAPALSNVTEAARFGGSIDTLRRICSACGVPVLRKDFIETADDLRETADAGASAILLIYSCLGRAKLEKLYEQAFAIGLVPFVEAHTAEEAAWASELGAALAGINNRDILVLEKDSGDVSRSGSLLGALGGCGLKVSESSMRDRFDVVRALRGGADAALVGTALLTAEDPGKAYRDMTAACGLKICGCMTEDDLRLCAESAQLVGIVAEYPKDVPWNVSKDRAKQLLARVPENCRSVVVTGGSEDKVVSLAEDLRPDLVQLHYRESLAETARIAERLARAGTGVIRSVSADPSLNEEMFGTADLVKIAERLSETRICGILFDGRDARNAENAYTASFEPRALKAACAASKKPVLLGGGVMAENIPGMIASFGPDYIDVMSASEDRPGVKSKEKIERLARSLG